MVLTFGYEVIKQRHTGVEYNNIWPDQISLSTTRYITVMWNNQEGKFLFLLFFNAMFNRFLRRKLNPKLQECMISTLVGHSGFELSLYSEKDWSNGADSMNAKKSWKIKLQFKGIQVFHCLYLCACMCVCMCVSGVCVCVRFLCVYVCAFRNVTNNINLKSKCNMQFDIRIKLTSLQSCSAWTQLAKNQEI